MQRNGSYDYYIVYTDTATTAVRGGSGFDYFVYIL